MLSSQDHFHAGARSHFTEHKKRSSSPVQNVTVFDCVLLDCDLVRKARIPLHLSTTSTSDAHVQFGIQTLLCAMKNSTKKANKKQNTSQSNENLIFLVSGGQRKRRRRRESGHN